MAAVGRFKIKQPLDDWSIREKLALSCSVLRSGDQNWVSVSRQIKPFGEVDRPSEWFSQRNCAIQYTDLLETVETPNRRKRGERESTESPQLLIARKLTLERVEELRELVKKQQDDYYKLRDELEQIKAGQFDDKLQDMWTKIQEEEQGKLELAALKAERGDGDATPSLPSTPVPSAPIKEVKIKIEAEDTSVDTQISVTEDDVPLETEEVPQEVVEEEIVEYTIPLVTRDDTPVSTESDNTVPIQTNIPQLSREATPASVISESAVPIQETMEDMKKANLDIKQEIVSIKQEPTEEVVEVEAIIDDGEVIMEHQSQVKIEDDTLNEVPIVKKEVEVKLDVEVKEEEEDETWKEPTPSRITQERHESVHVDENQPLSPASSVASHDTDVTHQSSGRRGRSKSRGNRKSRRSQSSRKEPQEEKESKIPSEIDSSDDDEKASNASTKPSMSFVGSLPCSPAGSNQGDMEVADREHRNWKKSIMLVWRAASNHKYAKVFQQPVTDSIAPGYKSIVLRYACVFSHPVTEEIAPGYHDIVYRPMDLQTIKKNIELGLIHTTSEFQRDIMLMFTNAIMYNNCDHNVYHMAQEMYDDVMQHIEQYINTQVMLNSESTPTGKILRQSRRTDAGLSGSERSDIDKEEDPKKRRTSTEVNTTDGGKAKKRKT